jgi:hypothetical protein
MRKAARYDTPSAYSISAAAMHTCEPLVAAIDTILCSVHHPVNDSALVLRDSSSSSNNKQHIRLTALCSRAKAC